MKSYIYIVILLTLGTSCKKFLEKEPLKQTSIKNVDQLQALIDDVPFTFFQEVNITAGFSTDDTEITPEQYKQNPTRVSGMEQLYYYVFNVNQIAGTAADRLWTGEFRKIFTANIILENVDNVTGSEAAKALVKADGYFIRAYSHFLLANYYCLPYSTANLSAPGLPLKRSGNVEESLKRSTIDETYKFILADLMEAMKTASVDVDPLKPWRVTKRTVEAMLSRYYLFTGDYPKALEYADKALTSTKVVLKDYKTIAAGVPAKYSNPEATLELPETFDYSDAQYIYWPEFYYPRGAYLGTQWFIPSASLRAMYEGQNDLRYKWFMIENGGRRFGVVTPEMFRYSVFDDGSYIPSGLTRAEMLLNQAEALARMDKPAEAMAAVNELRAARFTTPTDLTAANKEQAIANVLAERRREFPFAMRWMDIRRFSVNDYAGDDVQVSRSFFKVNIGSVDVNTAQTYTLPVGSKRYAVPINGVDIDASRGQIEQNVYDN